MPKREDEYWAGTKEPERRGLCPFCGSSNLHYNKPRKYWQCGKCEKTFPSPSYGPGKDSGKEARLYGKTTAQLRAELRAESVPPVTAHQERVPEKDKFLGLKIPGLYILALVLLTGISIFLVSYFVYSNRSSGDDVEPGIETFTSPLAILSSPIPQQAPTQELKELIQYMLDLINKDREDYGLAPVVLGNNIAAQRHAEEMLAYDYLSHWGMDGLKPYMRYTLEGGYNYEAENASGLLSPLEEDIEYRKESPEQLLRETQEGFMDSPGHRENILNKWHKKVNLGIACNQYTCSVAQQFEGDYVEFSELPRLSDGVLTMSGQFSGGFSFHSIQVWYDEPLHSLTFGQLGATFSYTMGQKPVAFIREPAPSGSYYIDSFAEYSWESGIDPYSVDPDTSRPESICIDFSCISIPPPVIRLRRTALLPGIDADVWDISGESFRIKADLSPVLTELGPGVYTIVIIGENDTESKDLTNYSIFVE